MAPLVRTGGSRHTGLAAPPHRNIQLEDRNADIVTVNDKKYIQTNIKGKSIENWMLYEKMKNK